MKINNTPIQCNRVVIPIIRDNGDTRIYFEATAVTDFEEFDRLCPEPVPGKRVYPDGTQVADTSAPEYIKAYSEWSENRMTYIILKSLSITKGLTWDKVVLEKPETWKLIDEELKESGLTPIEIRQINNGVWEAQGLDNAKIQKAREDFLASQRQQEGRQ